MPASPAANKNSHGRMAAHAATSARHGTPSTGAARNRAQDGVEAGPPHLRQQASRPNRIPRTVHDGTDARCRGNPQACFPRQRRLGAPLEAQGGSRGSRLQATHPPTPAHLLIHPEVLKHLSDRSPRRLRHNPTRLRTGSEELQALAKGPHLRFQLVGHRHSLERRRGDVGGQIADVGSRLYVGAQPLGCAPPAKHKQGHPIGGGRAARGQASRRRPARQPTHPP